MRFFILLIFIISCNSNTNSDNYLNIIPTLDVSSNHQEFSNINAQKVEHAYSTKNDKIPITYGFLKNISEGDSESSTIKFEIDELSESPSEKFFKNPYEIGILSFLVE